MSQTQAKPYGFPKPARGEALLDSRGRRAARVAAEQKEMQAALKRDGRVCRWPECEYRSQDLPIDPAHVFQHRGAGGNPKGDRTKRELIAALCRAHHGLLDVGQCEIHQQSSAGTDGLLDYYRRNEETGRMEHVYSETKIGVSVAVGL